MTRKHQHSHASASVRHEASFPGQNEPARFGAATAAEHAAGGSTQPPEGAAASQFARPPAGAHPVEPPPIESSQLEPPSPLLTKLLSIADMYRAEKSIHQAMSIYFELAEDHAGTPEAYEALERLLDVAKKYEDAGEIRQARSLYERLL